MDIASTLHTDQEIVDELTWLSQIGVWEKNKNLIKKCAEYFGVYAFSAFGFSQIWSSDLHNSFVFVLLTALLPILAVSAVSFLYSVFIIGQNVVSYMVFKSDREKKIKAFSEYLYQNDFPKNILFFQEIKKFLGIEKMKDLVKLDHDQIVLMGKDKKINAFATQSWGEDWASKTIRVGNKKWLAEHIPNMGARLLVLEENSHDEAVDVPDQAPSPFVLVLDHASPVSQKTHSENQS